MQLSRVIAATAFLSLLISWGCPEAEPETAVVSVPSVESPRIDIVRPNRDLGDIPLAPRIEAFEVRNVGQETLVIHGLEKSCGCVDVRLLETTIPSGSQTVLEVDLDPRQPEVRSTSITVHSNDPTAPFTRMILSWTARGPISVEPRELDFGTVRPGITTTRIVHVKQDLRQLKKQCALRMQGTPALLFTATRRAATQVDKIIEDEWQVDLTVNRDTIESSGYLIVSDPTDPEPLLRITASWEAREEIDVSPGRVFLGANHASQDVLRTVQVSCDADRTLEIQSVRHVGTMINIKPEIVVLTPQITQINIWAVLPDEPGTYLEALQIVCREPFEKTLDVPLSCVVLASLSSATP